MSRVVRGLLIWCPFVACAHSEVAEVPATAEPARSVPLADAAVEKPHPRPRTARVQPTTILELVPETAPGASVDWAAPSLLFHTPYVTKGSRFQVARLDGIAASACFISATGEVTPAYGQELSTAGEPTQGHSFELRSQRPLQPNRWYRLVLELGPALRMHPLFSATLQLDLGKNSGVAAPDAPDAAGGSWSQHFFTGSSPRVVAARLIESEPEPTLQLTLSEALLVTRELCQALVPGVRAAADRDCEALVGEQRSQLSFSLRPGEPFGHRGSLDLQLRAGDQSGKRAAASPEPRATHSKGAFALSLSERDFGHCAVNQRCWSEPAPQMLTDRTGGCH